MSDVICTTGSDEHKINTDEKQEPQRCELTDREAKQDIMDNWGLLGLIRQVK